MGQIQDIDVTSMFNEPFNFLPLNQNTVTLSGQLTLQLALLFVLGEDLSNSREIFRPLPRLGD